MGTLIVSKTSPSATLKLIAPKTAEYEYRLIGESHQQTEDGLETLLLTGSGKISVIKEIALRIKSKDSTSNSAVIYLAP
jgi:hypothetical protein